jgi:hypothetical protein
MEKQYLIVDSNIIHSLVVKVDELQRKVDALTAIKAEAGQSSVGVNDKVLHTEDVCKLFNINNDRVSIWIKQGKLRKINPAGAKHSLFDKDEVFALLEKQERKKPEQNIQAPKKKKRKISKYGINQFI